MVQSVQALLGPQRLRNLLGLLIGTGVASTILQVAFPDANWLVSAQMGLFVVFLGGAFFIVVGVFSKTMQWRLMFTIIPMLIAISLGAIIPSMAFLFTGVAIGWLVVSQIFMRDSSDEPYKQAVKALRKNDYPKALEQMDELIAQSPDVAEHYAFRAQLHRLNNNLTLSEKDYRRALELSPDAPIGANGLSELYLQRNDLVGARHWAEQAYKIAPKEWVVVYNLGMIAERQHDDKNALRYLREALSIGIKESRHRLLAQLWIARICYRAEKMMDAEIAVVALRKERKGMHEWRVTLNSEESLHLRTVFQQDVRLAQALMEGRSLQDVFATAG